MMVTLCDTTVHKILDTIDEARAEVGAQRNQEADDHGRRGACGCVALGLVALAKAH
jgi:hypothetical protein